MGDDVFQIDTFTINDLGQGIVSAAQSEESSPDPQTLENFVAALNKSTPDLPLLLQAAFTTFTTNFQKGYMDVLDQRIAIGHVLMLTASATEKQEVETVNAFTDIAPQAY